MITKDGALIWVTIIIVEASQYILSEPNPSVNIDYYEWNQPEKVDECSCGKSLIENRFELFELY